MASLIRRSNAVFYVVSCKGKRRLWRSLQTKKIDEARVMFAQQEREQELKKIMRLSSFLEDFEQRAHLQIAESTIGIYRSAFANFIRSIGDKPIRLVTPLDIEKFKRERSKEVLPVTLNIDLRTLRAAFHDARRLKIIEESPFEGMKLARVEDKEAVFLTQKEIQRLLMIIGDDEFRQLVLFAIYTMVRLGELVHLEWSDIDIVRREIHIRNKKGFRVKGGKPRRVPMNNWVYDFLSKKSVESGFVFRNAKGYPLIGGSVSHKFKKYVRRAELDDGIHFHSLRHTGISLLANNGVPQTYIQRIAGHLSPLTTQIYTHVEDRNLISAINTFPSFN